MIVVSWHVMIDKLTCTIEGKRKASEDPESPVAAKRIKHDDSAEPEPKPKVPAIPFPEKVCLRPTIVPLWE